MARAGPSVCPRKRTSDSFINLLIRKNASKLEEAEDISMEHCLEYTYHAVKSILLCRIRGELAVAAHDSVETEEKPRLHVPERQVVYHWCFAIVRGLTRRFLIGVGIILGSKGKN